MQFLGFTIFIIFLTTPHLIISRDVECSYGQGGWGTFGVIYVAVAKSPFEIISPDQTFLDSASGSHMTGLNHDSVISFSTVSIKVHYFPRGLEQVFKNLQGIEIRSCHLKEIHQADLRWYPKLLELHVTDNDLEVIEPGLFEYNPELRLVSFHKNKINKIGSNVFDHLTKLANLNLLTNSCIDKNVSGNRGQVQVLLKEVKSLCPSPLTPTANCLDICSRCQSDVSTLNHEVDMLKASNVELRERIEKLEGKSQCSVKEIANKLRTLVDELEGCEA